MTDDELDNQVRGAMKVLDAEVPSGYFDGLPHQTLARLEDRSMNTPTTTGPRKSEVVPPQLATDVAADAASPAPTAEGSGSVPREDDSGLHDIRSLAQSTKQRLSKKITAAPPIDEDVLASSSAGWKNVALPEPAKMISLPALDELPSKKQIKEQIKAAKAAPVATTRPPTHLDDSAPVARAAPAASMSFGANIVKQKGSKAPLYAVIGLGLAAAAGGLIYVATQGGSKSAPVVAKADEAPRAPVVPAAPTPPPPVAIAAPPIDTAAATGSAAEVVAPPADVPAATTVAVPSKHAGKSGPMGKKSVESKPTDAKPESPKKPEATKVTKPGGKEPAKEGEPDFNDLLKQAGVKDPEKAKPKLEKKSLSGSDFKAGMNSIASKASACYAGTQGTASVKLTVAPSGQVTKATVSGPFAGTAVAACVEAAVRGASFPAWEGGPQSFGYSFLLSE